MSDRAAFLRAICESPDDDSLRLVFADWLDEHGEADYAHFIRMRPPEVKVDTFNLGAALAMCRVTIDGIDVLSYFGQVDPPQATIRHGFISRIRLPLAAFMQHAKALFSAAPIEVVELSDKRPLYTTYRQFTWQYAEEFVPINDESRRYHLPSVLRPYFPPNIGTMVPGWITEELASEASSAACVRYGRQLAGLPVLEPVGAKHE